VFRPMLRYDTGSMAKKKDTNEEAAASPLVDAAKTIGEAAGTVVAAVEGVVGKTSAKVPKLAPKGKARLPRKAKKAKQKAAAEHSRKKALQRKQSGAE
jgi:hypothetical protein